MLHRLISYLVRTKTRLSYHWSELWRTLLSLIRFLTTYSSDLASNWQIRPGVIDPLCNLIAFCLSSGDNFLPDPASYDDLFYKLVETGDILTKFGVAYNINPTPPDSTASTRPRMAQRVVSGTSAAGGTSTPTSTTPTAANTLPLLLSISSHYHTLLATNTNYKSRNLSPQQVQEVIRSGYETLTFDAPKGLAEAMSGGEKWRENEWKGDVKRCAREAVVDVKAWMGQGGRGNGNGNGN